MSDTDVTQEIWKEIPEWRGHYEASNLGRIRRLSATSKKPVGSVLATAVGKTTGSIKGYRIANLWRPGIRRSATRYVHRLVWSAFHGHIRNGLVINHLNGDGTDNRLANLELCTRKQNVWHSVNVLKNGVGERNHGHKLNTEVVLQIKRLKASGHRNIDISRQLRIPYQYIADITTGRTWAHPMFSI